MNCSANVSQGFYLFFAIFQLAGIHPRSNDALKIFKKISLYSKEFFYYFVANFILSIRAARFNLI